LNNSGYQCATNRFAVDIPGSDYNVIASFSLSRLGLCDLRCNYGHGCFQCYR